MLAARMAFRASSGRMARHHLNDLIWRFGELFLEQEFPPARNPLAYPEQMANALIA